MRWQRILGVFFRYFYSLRKGPQQLADLLYWPLMDILIWGLTSVWIQRYDTSSSLSLALLTGLIFWQVSWRGSIDVSVNLLQEFWERNLVNLFSSPLTLWEWIGGILLLSLGKLVITLAFGSGLVYLLYGLNVFTIGWQFLPFAAVLLVFGWSLGFLAAALIIYWGHRIEAAAWMVAYAFAPFSAVFYPVNVLPPWAQMAAWCLPSTYIFEGMRAILMTHSFPAYYFWCAVLLDGVFLVGSLSLFRWMFHKSKEKGLARVE